MGVRKVLYIWVREVKVLGGFWGVRHFWRFFAVVFVWKKECSWIGKSAEKLREWHRCEKFAD